MKAFYFSERKARLSDRRKVIQKNGIPPSDMILGIAKTIPGFWEKVIKHLAQNFEKKQGHEAK